MTVKLKQCSECSFLDTERMYTEDSFEMAFNWFCKAESKRKIAGYVEAFDKPKIPMWCPLRKAGMVDTSRDPFQIKPGDKLVVRQVMGADSGYGYVPGMILEVLEETQDNPHNVKQAPGSRRWRVRCPFQVSIWCALEPCIEKGILGFMQEDEIEVPKTVMFAAKKVASDEP